MRIRSIFNAKVFGFFSLVLLTQACFELETASIRGVEKIEPQTQATLPNNYLLLSSACQSSLVQARAEKTASAVLAQADTSGTSSTVSRALLIDFVTYQVFEGSLIFSNDQCSKLTESDASLSKMSITGSIKELTLQGSPQGYRLFLHYDTSSAVNLVVMYQSQQDYLIRQELSAYQAGMTWEEIQKAHPTLAAFMVDPLAEKSCDPLSKEAICSQSAVFTEPVTTLTAVEILKKAAASATTVLPSNSLSESVAVPAAIRDASTVIQLSR